MLGLIWLIHDLTITPQFPYLSDYGNFMFFRMDRCSNPNFINMIYDVLIESLRYLFDDDYFIVGN
jgi:hypothetical protein